MQEPLRYSHHRTLIFYECSASHIPPFPFPLSKKPDDFPTCRKHLEEEGLVDCTQLSIPAAKTIKELLHPMHLVDERLLLTPCMIDI
jgi:hypothetical protein